MQYSTLGRTGLKVSVAGLGCGGHSRLGQRTGKTEQQSIGVVHQALDLGINLIDTAEAYKTEKIVGKAIQGIRRDQIVISTKTLCPSPDSRNPGGALQRGVEQSLKRLQTDYVEVFYLHGVRPKQYQYARDTLVPVLLKLREEGKIRFIGVTEAFIPDPQHAMLKQALKDDCWDVMMVGFNLLNQSARQRVFPKTQAKNIGIMDMFAVRNALSRPDHLQKLLTELKDNKQIDPVLCDRKDLLGFLNDNAKTETIPEAAYRYCRHEPGIDTVLIGTGNVDHLKENVASLLKEPLVQEDRQRLREIFGQVDSVSGN